jgi:acetyl esterase/lipase
MKFALAAAKAICTKDPIRPLARRLAVALLKAASSTLTDEQSRGRSPPTNVAVQRFCKKYKLGEPSSITIPVIARDLDVPPAVIHVIDTGASSEETINSRAIFYLHGGGYVHYPSPVGQLPLLLEAQKARPSRFLLVLQYGVAPGLLYPGQLVQAAAAIQLLCGDSTMSAPQAAVTFGHGAKALLARKSSLRLTLLGDSAGGHLLLSLLAHIHTPHPSTPPITLAHPFDAAVILSPRVTPYYTASSYTYNESNDFLTKQKMLYFHHAWQPNRSEVWADFIHAAPSKDFWASVLQGPQRLVKETLITAGTDEVFLDDIITFAGKTAHDPTGSHVKLATCAGEAHVGIVIDLAVGIQGGQMRTAVAEFLENLSG